MSKKTIIIFAVIGVLSCMLGFGAFLGISKIRNSKAQDDPAVQAEKPQAQQSDSSFAKETAPGKNLLDDLEPTQPTMEEKQLNSLIVDLKTTKQEYENKISELKHKEERLEQTRTTITKDLEKIRQLKADVINSISELKMQNAALKKTILEIKNIEKENLIKLAACYDKMDTTQAAQTMVTMIKSSQADDAVKLTYYMSDRIAAKLIGEISNIDSSYAAMMSSKLKRIKEQDN